MAFMNWSDLLGTLRRSFKRQGDGEPKMLGACRGVVAVQGSGAALDAKTRERIALNAGAACADALRAMEVFSELKAA